MARESSISDILWELGVTHDRDEHSCNDGKHVLFFNSRAIGRYSAYEVSVLLDEIKPMGASSLADTSDLVERLRAWSPLIASGYECPAASIAMDEAATTLEVQAKEIEALRAERDSYLAMDKGHISACENAMMREKARSETAERGLKQVTDECGELRLQFTNLCQEFDIRNDELEAAERERDQARAALKPFAAYSVGAIFKDENFDYRIHVCCSGDDQPQFKHFDAARAVIKQGE